MTMMLWPTASTIPHKVVFEVALWLAPMVTAPRVGSKIFRLQCPASTPSGVYMVNWPGFGGGPGRAAREPTFTFTGMVSAALCVLRTSKVQLLNVPTLPASSAPP
ncbi:hypothetical protein [Kibdelosporangium phytohabitans]|uniref:Uncharacterized protein n=1 Tax=Kibdelosporangium phytohabitans TaxID=860235 RepID=A0A0N9I1A3_9PSEU|nr:hypothetical protein [Kibdelosporangium phytohabitans]ALG08210.1 hypothetical protein AOZ06_15990 [Kibdelosporangium phytohabitans]MBE1470788.1 hypothetical protein [Kibdelosporangium phytohabitans]